MLACAPASADEKSDIQGLNDRFAASFNAGDLAAVADHYAEDAVALPSGAPMQRGRAAIKAYWTAAAGQVGDFKLTTLEVKPLGADALQEIGTFSLKTKATPPQTMDGKYVVIWRKVGGNWKLATDIWNADK
jgi:uncharacterized protein (TIGR02246 family)